MTTDTFRRAQAEAVVAKLRSATMKFSNPGEQLEYEITLAEAALSEQAKAAPVSDTKALEARREHVIAILENAAAEIRATDIAGWGNAIDMGVEAIRNDADTIATLRQKLERAEAERDRYRYAPQGDNHHNALTCPYCNPARLKFCDAALLAEAGKVLERARGWVKNSNLYAEIVALSAKIKDATDAR